MKRAFTLVEMLVVLSVIAVLIALALPGLAKGRKAARELACRENLRQLHGCTFAFWVRAGTTPTTEAEIAEHVSGMPVCPFDRERLGYFFFLPATENPDSSPKADVWMDYFQGELSEVSHGRAIAWNGLVRDTMATPVQ